MAEVVPTRVNVLDPEKNDGKTRTTAVTDQDGQSAHTATGQHVRITDNSGLLKDEVIVHPKDRR